MLIEDLIIFAKKYEPKRGYWGPETLVDLLHKKKKAYREFQELFKDAKAEDLDDIEEFDEDYGWIINGAADELDLLPDDPRLFKSEEDLNSIPSSELLGELCSACILNDLNAVVHISAKVDINQPDHNNQLAISYAIGNNHIECVRHLLEKGADPNLREQNGDTAMHTCAQTVSSKEIWQLLIDNNGDPELKNNDGKTAKDILKELGRSKWLAR